VRIDTIRVAPYRGAAHRPPRLPLRVEDSSGKEVTDKMVLISSFIASLRRDDEGQGLAEYALILALIAIIAIIALIFLGGQVSKILSAVGNSV
jgi:pilus assembly protein Flp/PilA